MTQRVGCRILSTTTPTITLNPLKKVQVNKLTYHEKVPYSNEKRSTTPAALPPLDDPNLPPPPDILAAKSAAASIVVTWNMQTSSGGLLGAVDAIGAHCPLEKVDKDAMFSARVAARGLTTHGESRDDEGGYELSAQNEKQCLERFINWLADISARKSEPMVSQNATSTPRPAIVLLSFGGIAARIPKLLLSLRKHKLLAQFQDVVIGVCDVNAAALSDDSSSSIGTISRNVLGVDVPSTETSDPAEQSRHLYRLVAQLFGKRYISAHLQPLARNTFTTSYVMKLSLWRLKTDHRANELRAILTTKVGKSVRHKRALIKNLLAVGYDYSSLRKQYHALGEFTFREVLHNKLRHMKKHRESNLTETKSVGCKTLIESVVNHYKEIQRDRLLKQAPLLD